jgi:hypothetical protein
MRDVNMSPPISLANLIAGGLVSERSKWLAIQLCRVHAAKKKKKPTLPAGPDSEGEHFTSRVVANASMLMGLDLMRKKQSGFMW